MSDGRKRLSGAAYRKEKLKKLKNEEEARLKSKKIFNYFRKPESGHGSNETVSDADEPGEMPNITLKEKDAEDTTNLIPQASLTSPVQDSQTYENKDSEGNDSMVYDPFLWPINESTREHVLKNDIIQDISKLDFSRSTRFIGGQNRSLTKALFETSLVNGQKVKRSYLMYSESSGNLFCIPCQLFGGVSKLAKGGFDDWKHGNAYLNSHENSPDHKSCVLVMRKRMTTAQRIDSQLLIQIHDEEKYWQNVLKRVVAVVKSLAAAGLPLRGHIERFGSSHNCGNFIMCAELISEFDPFLASHISKYGNPGQGHTSYLSSSTYEQFLKIMSCKVTEEIVKKIKAAKYFSLVIDSTPDIAHVDQLAIIIRYVDEKGIPVERFLCFLPNVGHKAEELFNAVINVLDTYGIDIQNCRGQSYDNASNMSGQYTGLQARIKEKIPTALYCPCSAHSLNLVGEHSTSSCKESRDFFMLLNNLYNFFSCSTKRWEVLTGCLSKKNLTLKTLSKTRWSARDDACKALNEDWQEVVEALTIISNDDREKAATRSEASSYLNQVQRLETAFLSIVWGNLLGRFNVTSKKLQSSEIDLSTVSILYGSLSEYIQVVRTEFETYENEALLKSKVSQYEDEKNRRKIRKIQSGESREGEVEFIGRENFKINTFNVIMDRLYTEIQKRKVVYDKLNSLFGFFVCDNKNSFDLKTLDEHSKILCTLYDKDLPSTEIFVNECKHFFGFLKDAQEYPKTIPKIYKVLHDNEVKDVYPYIDIALRLFLTIPASNCSAERSFSVLKRIKNYTRSTMTQERLKDVAILTIESEITKQLDFDDIINSFSTSRTRKKVF